MASIETFFKKIVPSTSAMYQGEWKVTDSDDIANPKGVLRQAFGSREDEENGQNLIASVSSGKVRSFIQRQSTRSSTSLLQLFNDDEKEDASSGA